MKGIDGVIPAWIVEFDTKDPQNAKWLLGYFKAQDIQILRNPGESTVDAAKRHVVNLYKKADESDYRFLRNIREAHRQRVRRSNETETVERTFRISNTSVKALESLSNKLGVSREKIVDSLIKEHGTVDALYDLKEKKGAKLTTEQIGRSYARHHNVGDLVFGSRAFDNEESLVQRIRTIVKKLNIAIKRRGKPGNPLSSRDFVRVMEKEGVLHDVAKSYQQAETLNRLKDPISGGSLEDYSDDTHIEDFIYLDDALEKRLGLFRTAACKHQDVKSEQELVSLLLDGAEQAYTEGVKLNSIKLQREKLEQEVINHRKALAKSFDDLELEDENDQRLVELCRTLRDLVLKFYKACLMEKATSEGLRATLEHRRPERPSRFKGSREQQSRRDLNELVASIVAGSSRPEDLWELDFEGIARAERLGDPFISQPPPQEKFDCNSMKDE